MFIQLKKLCFQLFQVPNPQVVNLIHAKSPEPFRANPATKIVGWMMMNMEHAYKTLKNLKHLGCKIAIDDFGTGYSSLNHLKHLPIDRLKIDQSFIRDLVDDEQDDTIVSTIISMAKHLQLDVIAEGVETPEQRAVLQKKQCTYVQGYLYSPPLAPESFLQQWELLHQKAKTL